MKILQTIKVLSALVFLSGSLSYADDDNLGPLQTKTTAGRTVIMQSDPADIVPPPVKTVSKLDYFLVNPFKAIGFGLFVGFGSPVNGCSKLFDALRGYEKVDVTKQPVSTQENPSPTPLPSVYENTSLDFSQRWGKVKEGTFYIVGAPLIGATFFLLSLRSFNNPGGGF